jgi:hypothetical protein
MGQLAVAPAQANSLSGLAWAERPLEALVLTGTDAVTRDVEVHDSQQLIQVFPRQVLSQPRVAMRPTS